MIKCLALVLLLSGVAVADATFANDHQTATVDCAKDSAVMIGGNHATITLTGVCESVMIGGNNAKVVGSAKSVTVAGNNNTVELDVVDRVTVPGNANTVTYQKSSDAKKPTKVSNPGNKNSIKRKK